MTVCKRAPYAGECAPSAGYSLFIGGTAPTALQTMPIYIHKTAAAFHIFEDWQGYSMKRKVAQFATWEELLAAIRTDFQGRQIIPQF